MNLFIYFTVFLTIFTMASCAPSIETRRKTTFNAIENANYDYISKLQNIDIEIKDRYKRNLLMIAILNNDFKMVKLLLKKGANIEARDVFGETPIMKTALITDNLEIAKLLIGNNADINAVNKYGGSVLMRALSTTNDKLVEYLIEKGVNIHYFKPKNTENALILSAGGNQYRWMSSTKKYIKMVIRSRRTGNIKTRFKKVNPYYGLLFFSFINNLKIMKLLIKNGMDINYSSKYGKTALINSIISENIESIKWLLENGADINLKAGEHGTTALIEAAKRGNINIVKLLFKNKADPAICDKKNNYSPYIYAIMNHNKLVTNFLKDFPYHCSDYDMQLFHLVLNKRYSILKKLNIKKDFTIFSVLEGIKTSIDLNNIKMLKILTKDFDKDKTNHILKYALENAKNKTINYLIKNNFKLEKDDENIIFSYKLGKLTLKDLEKEDIPKFINKKENITPLMLASLWQDIDLVKLILSKDKLSLNKIDKKGFNALSYSLQNGDNEINDYLLKNKISTQIYTSKNYRQESMIMLALKNKAKKLAYKLVKKKKYFKMKTNNRSNLLIYAVKYNSYDTVKYLLEQKYLRSINKALLLASKNSSLKIVKLLIEHGAKVDAYYYVDNTPLMNAIIKNKVKIIKFLLENHADLEDEDDELWNSLIFAARFATKEVFNLILKDSLNKNSKTGKNSNLFVIASIKKNNTAVLKEINKLDIDVNEPNIIGETALMTAVKENRLKNVKYLLSIGANPLLNDINEHNSFHYAETRGYKNILNELNKYKVGEKNKN